MAKKKRKRYNPSRHLPAIEPHPNLDPDKIVHLPKIIDACQPTLRPKDVDKLKVRLNFADHRDFRKLGCIRIVNPETIRMPSKETTTGLYRPKHCSMSLGITKPG